MDMTRCGSNLTEMDGRAIPFMTVLTGSICIPKYIELSNFVTHDEDKMSGGIQKKYRLVFYSTVCHRGQYVSSGHYVSVVWDRQTER
jgi:hypothetical protein